MATIAGFVGVIWKFLGTLRLIQDGVMCQLRASMLSIYYRNADAKEIRQYEMENFLKMYRAYKAMGGNSFIEEIYQEVTSWKIIT